MNRLRDHLFKPYLLVMVFFAGLFLTGCGTTPAPTNILTRCPSPSSQVYNEGSIPELQDRQAKDIVDKISAAVMQNNLAGARREGMRFLAFETVRWSDYKIIEYQAQPRMRIVTTFITPGLVRAIVLNDWLSKVDTAERFDLAQKTADSLAKLEKKNELEFFILFQSEESITPISYSIFPNKIRMHNTIGYEVESLRSDDYLNSALLTSERNHSGFFSFPAGVNKDGACGPLLNHNTDTSLVLRIDNAVIGQYSNVSLSWRISFPILAELNDPLFKLDLASQVFDGSEQILKSRDEAPDVDYNSKSITEAGWRDIGRYIWWNLTREHLQR